jgi:hypothetical protein
MRFTKHFMPCMTALVALTGCGSRPSEGFLDLVRQERTGAATPEITIHLGRAIEERASSGGQESGLRKAMEALGNQMGFRIEASTGGSRYLTTTRYVLADMKDPGLSGITIIREGDVVRIRPDYRREVIIESAATPRDGFEKMIATAPAASAQDKAGAEAMLALFGDKDAKGTVAKIEATDQETRKRKVAAFETNVDRVRKDNGYAKAWFITYRLRHATNIPQESPFWILADALGRVRAKDVIERNPAYTATSSLWASHGKQDTKSSLTTYASVAFEDSKGHLAKTEPWLTFKGE